MHSITPHLVCAGGLDAIDFYKKAFNAEEMMKLPGKDGKLMHGCIRIGNSLVMLTDEYPEWGVFGPGSLNGTTVTIHMQVEDADSHFNRAVEAGCTVHMPMDDMFWGDRYGIVKDPYGHLWSIATHIRDVSPEEIQASVNNDCA